MSKQDDFIVKCAIRIVDKIDYQLAYKDNGELSKSMRVEIERMKNHCRDKHDEIKSKG